MGLPGSDLARGVQKRVQRLVHGIRHFQNPALGKQGMDFIEDVTQCFHLKIPVNPTRGSGSAFSLNRFQTGTEQRAVLVLARAHKSAQGQIFFFQFQNTKLLCFVGVPVDQ